MKKTSFIYLIIVAPALAAAINAQTFNVKNQSVDLRPKIKEYGLAVRDQGSRGTCTIFATTFLIEFKSSQEKNAKNIDFSEEYLNAVANRAGKNKNDGAFFSEAIAGYEEFGILPENFAPYKASYDVNFLAGEDDVTMTLLDRGKYNRGYQGEVSVSANQPDGLPGLSDAQLSALVSELDKGNAVAIGHGGDAGNTKTVLLDNGWAAFASYDINKLVKPYVHTVPLVGYKIDKTVSGGGYFIFRNSAGASWGDARYFRFANLV